MQTKFSEAEKRLLCALETNQLHINFAAQTTLVAARSLTQQNLIYMDGDQFLNLTGAGIKIAKHLH